MTIPKSASKKQPPPGLESEPRSGCRHDDNVELLNYVREELKKLEWDARDKLMQALQAGTTPAKREALASWFRAEPRSPQSRPDPLKAAIAKAKSTGRAAPLLAYLNEQFSGTGIKVRVIMPKQVRGHRRSRFRHGVPPPMVETARDILAIMRRHFTPKQRKAWWSVGTMATILWYEGEDPAFAKAMIKDPTKFDDPTKYRDWARMIDRRIKRGDEKRTWRERSLAASK